MAWLQPRSSSSRPPLGAPPASAPPAGRLGTPVAKCAAHLSRTPRAASTRYAGSAAVELIVPAVLQSTCLACLGLSRSKWPYRLRHMRCLCAFGPSAEPCLPAHCATPTACSACTHPGFLAICCGSLADRAPLAPLVFAEIQNMPTA